MRNAYLKDLPVFCHFYSGMTPDSYWRLRLDEYEEMVRYMNDYNTRFEGQQERAYG